MRSRIAASAAAVVVAAAVAGCGGSSDAATSAAANGIAPATAPAQTTTPGVSPPTATVEAPSTTIGEDRLPPQDALPGLRVGSLQQSGDVRAFVDALYRAGDPAKAAATARLRSGGYAGAALRDQVGINPTEQIALFRAYAILLRDEAAARAEAAAAVQEVRDSTTAPTTGIALPDIPGAQGLHVEIDQDGVTGTVVFVTFAAGPFVYGLQGVSTDDAALPQDEMIGAARDLYERVTAAP